MKGLGTFRSLSSRNLRLYLGGQTVSVIGTWLQKAAQAWLVLELTESAAWLGVTAGLQHLPTLVMGLWGGLLADRMDKRKLLLLCQSFAPVPAVALGVFTATGAIELWMVLVLALMLGMAEAVDRPARHTFISEIVDHRDSLTNAVTLNSIVQNFGKVVGPAIAGLLIAEVGLAVTFFLNAASYLAVIAGLLLIRPDHALRPAPAGRKRGQIMDALRYVSRTPALLGPLMVMTVAGMLAYEWQVTLPVLARESFGADARVFGFMFATMGLGATLGGLALAGVLRASIRGFVVVGLAFSALLVALAAVPWLTGALVLLFMLGAGSVAFRAVASSYMQLTASPQTRGRVIALLFIAFTGTTPLGGPLLGWICDVLDARVAFLVGGIGTAVALLGMCLYLRKAVGPHRAHGFVAVRTERGSTPAGGP